MATEEEFLRKISDSELSRATPSLSFSFSSPPSSSPSPPPDPDLVTWNGPGDPENPKNWPMKEKWMASVPMSLFSFLGAMSSATAAPALIIIQEDLEIHSNTLVIMCLSVYVLGSAITPLFTAPLSEIFGRVKVLQATNLFYLVFNTLCGAAKSQNQLIAFRFLAGLGGSGPQAIASGIIGDMFRTHERGKAIAIYTAAPLIGTIIGPIAGGFLVQYQSWRWCFYIVSIASAAVQLVGPFILRETYPPVLIQWKCKELQKATQNPKLYTEYDSISFPKLLRSSLVRPFRLLGTQPIVQVLSLYVAYLNGILYLMVATYPLVWAGTYLESPSIGSLNYISFSIGMIIATPFGTRLADRFYNRLYEKNDGQGHPEFRLPVLCAGAFIVPVGLFWYGWSAREGVHWIMPNIGAAIYAGATLIEFICVQGYLVDTYPLYAASATASTTVLKSLFGFALPLTAPSLYDSIGFAWGISLLAFIAIFIGIPAPFLLWYFGAALRKRSPYAIDD